MLCTHSTQSSVNAVSARLTEKTQELNSAQMESDRLQATISTLEGRIRAMETTAHAKVNIQLYQLWMNTSMLTDCHSSL